MVRSPTPEPLPIPPRHENEDDSSTAVSPPQSFEINVLLPVRPRTPSPNMLMAIAQVQNRQPDSPLIMRTLSPDPLPLYISNHTPPPPISPSIIDHVPPGPQPSVHPGIGWHPNLCEDGIAYPLTIPNSDDGKTLATFVSPLLNNRSPRIRGTAGLACPIEEAPLHACADQYPCAMMTDTEAQFF